MTQPPFDPAGLLAREGREVIYRCRVRPHQIEYLSPSVATLTGRSADDFYANPDLGLEIVHPEDRHLARRMRDEPEATLGEPIVVRCRRHDGRLVWAEHRRRPVYDERGELLAIEGCARDVTEEVTLRRECDTLRAALGAVTDAVTSALLVHAGPGLVLAINRPWRERFGLGVADEALVGARLEDLTDRAAPGSDFARFLRMAGDPDPDGSVAAKIPEPDPPLRLDHHTRPDGSGHVHVWICRPPDPAARPQDANQDDDAAVRLLSGRESQVLRMIGTGKTVSAIAAELHLSVKTVSTYRARLLQKMQMRTNAELMRFVIRRGLGD